MRKKFLMTLVLGLALTLTPAAVLADPEVKTGVETEADAMEETEGEDVPVALTEPEIVSYTEGWNTVTDEDGVEHHYYYEKNSDGELVRVTNTQKKISGKNYLFDEEGERCTGFYPTKADGKAICFFDENGVQFIGTGWVEYEEKFYYVKSDHVLVDGDGLTGAYIETTTGENIAWLSLDGAWYLMDADAGYRLSGWQEAKTALYYLNPAKGDKMETGDSNGWKQIDGIWYDFQSWGGARRNCWWTYKSNKYHFDQDGKMAAGGPIEIGGDKYFFYDWGGMRHDTTIEVGDVIYTLGSDGKVKGNGEGYWVLDSNGVYHWIDSTGKKVKGQEIEYKGRIYYLDANGNMLSNAWRQDGDKWYYYVSWGGRARSEWIYYKSNYYYFDKSGVMMHDRWFDGSNEDNTNPSNKVYYFQSWGGRCANGKYTINGTDYYFDNNGRRCEVGYFWQDGYRYYRMANGSICYNLATVDPGYVQTCNKRINIDRTRGIVTVYGYYKGNGYDGYNTPLMSMWCSVGKASTPTTAGTHYTGWKKTWKQMTGSDYVCWASYLTQIVGTIYFHAVASANPELSQIMAYDFNALGTPQSHGCVRLYACEAKWIYQYVKSGTRVYVGDNLACPLPNPARYRWTGGSLGSDPTWTPLSSSDFVA